MDDVDRAAEYQSNLNADSISHRPRPQQAGRSAYYCCDCDCRIPEPRRQACHCIRCAECQAEYEEAVRRQGE